MKKTISLASQRKDLGYALRPYKLWDDWVNSPVRPFTERELTLIEIYRNTGSYAACCESLFISMPVAATTITAIILRLKLQLNDYKRWEAGQRSLFDVLNFFGLDSVHNLKAITVNDLKLIIGEPFSLTYKPINHCKKPNGLP